MSENTLAEARKIQRRFVELLQELTAARSVEWVQAKHDPGFVYCLAGRELIVFELQGGTEATPVGPAEHVAGITSKCRNVTYLWLPVSEGWDALLALLREAPVNDGRFSQMKRSTYSSPVEALEALRLVD